MTDVGERTLASTPPNSPDGVASGPPHISTGWGAAVVAGIFLAITLGALDQFVVVTALPNIATSLGSPGGVAFVVSAYLVAAAVGILVFGRLTSVYGHRGVFLVGLLIFIGGSALAGISQNLDELITFRTVQGFAGDSFVVVGFALVADYFPPAARARITGLFTGSFLIATIVGPFVGSYIVDHASWRWVFYVNIPIALVSAAVIAVAVPSHRAATHLRFDTIGTALLTGWVAALTFALVQTSTGGWAWTDPRIVVSLVAGIAALVGFVLWEPRIDHALLPASLFRSTRLSSSAVVSLLRGTAMFAVYTFVAVYVGLVLQLGGVSAADHVRDVLYFLVVPAVIGAGVGSQLVTRISYRPLMLAGLGIASIGGVLITQISVSTPLWLLYYGFLPVGGLALPLIPLGFGIGITFPVTILAAQFSVSRREAGLATSVVEFTQTLGGAMGLSLLASFQQWRLASLAPANPSSCSTPATCSEYASAFQHATVVSLQEVFGIVTVLLLASLLAAWWMTGRLPQDHTAGNEATDSGNTSVVQGTRRDTIHLEAESIEPRGE